MPLFDFRCRECGDEFERLVRPPAAPICPACGSHDLERKTSAFAIRAGSGLSPAARRDVQKQQTSLHADKAAFQTEIEKKHLDD